MRTVRLSLLVFLAAPLSIAACGGGNEAPAGSTTGTAGAGAGGGGAGGGGPSGLPCDVGQILAANCQKCHAAKPVFGAPMPLVTYDDLHAPLKSNPSKQVYEQITVRIHDDKTP